MKMQRKWLFIAATPAMALAALAMGVSLSTLLFLGVALLCPAVMFFGMKGMGVQHGCGHCERHNHADAEAGAETRPEEKAA